MSRVTELGGGAGAAESEAEDKASRRLFIVSFSTPLPALDGMRNLPMTRDVDSFCRCAVGALLCSRRVRRDSTLLAVFAASAPGKPLDVLELRGAELRMLYAAKGWVSATLARFLAGNAATEPGASIRFDGWHLRNAASLSALLHELIAKVDGKPQHAAQVVFLHGRARAKACECLAASHVVGVRELIVMLGHEAPLVAEGWSEVSLGGTPLLSSQAIGVVQYLADELWPAEVQRTYAVPGDE